MDKELIKRIISSIILVPISLFFIIKGSIYFNFFFIICFLFSAYEWHEMSKKKFYNILGHLFLIFSFYSFYHVRNNFGEDSLFIFLFLIFISVSTDIGGYTFGKILKGPKLTKISPKKTYAGVFGGYILSIILSKILINYSLFFSNIILKFEINDLIFIIIISSVSQIGDILISYFKRLSNIKDTGKLIPGHGGILDRIDGMIFVFPFILILSLIVNLS